MFTHIKLNAIDSTNDYLKKMAQLDSTKTFTFVTAEHQTKGKGQMGATWQSELGKNLTMSVLIKDSLILSTTLFDMNVLISCSLLQVLFAYGISNCSVKWPNDIMADSKKVAGVLIENVFKADGKVHSIIGVGLNVNQMHFEHLPQATSMKHVLNQDIDLDEIANAIVMRIRYNWEKMNPNDDTFWKFYHHNLFKKLVPMTFEDNNGNRFMGIIKEVSRDGKLVVNDEDNTVRFYDLKQIKLLY